MAVLFEKGVKIAYIRQKTQEIVRMPDKNSIIYPLFKARRLILKQAGFNNQPAGKKRTLTRHTHNLWSLDFCAGGTSKIELEKCFYNFKKGDIMLIAPGKEHRFIYTRDTFSCYSFKMDIPAFENLPENSIYAGDPEGLKARLGMLEAVRHCLAGFCPEKLVNMNMPFTINSSFVDIHILEELLYGVASHYIFGGNARLAEQDEDTLIKKISEFIYLRNGKPVSVEEVAEHFGYSAGHLRTIVRKNTGLSTKTFIDMERIKIIKNLLIYSDIRVGELSQLMEFRDTKYFTRFFRKYTGELPRSWSKKKNS